MDFDYIPDASLANDDTPVCVAAEKLDAASLVNSYHHMLKQAQRRFGAARLEIGVLLDIIRSEALWKGRASNFGAFLEENGIKDSAAYLYMRVARKFYFDLQLSESEIEDLSLVSMGLLDLAAKVVTLDNKPEILAILTSLSERDARVALQDFGGAGSGPPTAFHLERPSPSVSRLYQHYRLLPDDQRLELLTLLQPSKGA